MYDTYCFHTSKHIRSGMSSLHISSTSGYAANNIKHHEAVKATVSWSAMYIFLQLSTTNLSQEISVSEHRLLYSPEFWLLLVTFVEDPSHNLSPSVVLLPLQSWSRSLSQISICVYLFCLAKSNFVQHKIYIDRIQVRGSSQIIYAPNILKKQY